MQFPRHHKRLKLQSLLQMDQGLLVSQNLMFPSQLGKRFGAVLVILGSILILDLLSLSKKRAF
jgi:hypothetical protein